MNFPRGQKGFSLVEALMVLGITTIIGFAVMQTMQDSANSMALSEAKFEQLELIRQIQTNLIYKPSCEMNLKTKTISGLNIADIQKLVDSNGHPILEKGQKFGNGSLEVKDFSFAITQQELDDFNAFKATWPAGVTSYMLDMQFIVKTEKLKTSMGGKFLTRAIPIKVKVDVSSIIQECFAANDAGNFTAMSNFCSQMGGTFNETTSLCNFNQNCATTTGAQLIPAKCVDEKMAALMASFTKQLADLEATRTVASVDPAATPAATPAYDPYKIPWSYANPGPGCTGSSCAASDFGPCNGTFCTTNGGSCNGIGCQAGVVTGVVKYDGTNMFSPSKPGPGCTQSSCHANDYGPCKGTFCTTNGGSCEGIGCRTGVTN
jgi:hypothetical protein